LLSNAIKFSRKGVDPQVNISAKREKGFWEFAISDNGIGIPSSKTENIFTIFRTINADGEYAGAGVGLALAQKITALHGGKIRVDSEPNKGSTFYFTISA
ncbi:MAG: ATP-binding protein, partial [Flavobacteriales bacterium]|nr:ATP-binding protein [Flavobacteriales bacterium]